MRYRLGIDVGGTFTDLMLLRETDWRRWTHKQLTTPADPVRGILTGLGALLAQAGLSPAEVADAHVVHGTTLVANALIERKGCRVGLITTRGTRDVLETGKENRYDPYDRYIRRPPPLVERALRREVAERIAPDGTVRRPLARAEVEAILDDFAAQEVECVAVCLLHAYRNAAHEQAVGELAASRGIPVSLSSVVSPELGEFERASTTVANAYIQPFTARYLDDLAAALREAGFRRGFYVMLSDGGIAAPQSVVTVPIRILESGPAAGALAAAFVARAMEVDRLIAFDMGGTTAKISVIERGAPSRTGALEVGRIDRSKKGSGATLRVPSVEMLEIGAGGGSVARVDGMGLLKVGPQSAGADPGPACYGLGGTEPTVTDANLLLGYLGDGAVLGGDLRLDRARSEAAAAQMARPIGARVDEAAAGIREVVTESMAHAVKLHVTEWARDPRAYALVAFGGAGPLHACAIARHLGIQRVIVPAEAGVLSALGFIAAPAAVEMTQSFFTSLAGFEGERLRSVCGRLEVEARSFLRGAGAADDEITLAYALEMRYAGQGYDVRVPLPPGADTLDPGALRERFEAAYEDVYGLRLPASPVEVRGVRLWASGPRPEVRLAEFPSAAVGSAPRPGRRRRASFTPGQAAEVPVYEREHLAPGTVLHGPCLVDERHATTVIPPEASCTVDRYGSLVIDLPAAAARRRTDGGKLGAVDVEILLSRLRAIMDECDRTVLRTAFSAVVREGKDYAVGMTDPQGNSLALPTETMPLFVTCMPRSVASLIEHFPLDDLRPGDVVVTNDPWIVAGHKNDLLAIQPIFRAGRPVAFMGAVSHLPDIGGTVGDFRAWDLYEEGLLIPPIKLYAEGRPNAVLTALLRANVRLPEEVMGDVGALVAALRVGEARIQEFLEATGLDGFAQLSEEIRARSQAAFRQAAARIPDGRYTYTFTADGVGGADGARESIEIAATLTVREGRVTVDYTGTSPQLPHFPINVPIPYTLSDTIYALQYLLSPALPNIGPSYDLVTVQAPVGSLLNPVRPAPVYARTRTGVHITTAICGALAPAAPALVMAGCGHNVIMRIAGVRADGSYVGIGMMPKGGMGATLEEDGWNVTVYPTNCTMISTEALELMGQIEMDREILIDSGGPGRRRGGTGQRVTLRSRADRPVTVSVRFNFVHHAPPGFLGGREGGKVRALLNGRPVQDNPVTLRPGDELVVETAGGGGIGDPASREPERVLEDVRQAYVSVKAAREVYQVVVDPATMRLDSAATAALRKAAGRERIAGGRKG